MRSSVCFFADAAALLDAVLDSVDGLFDAEQTVVVATHQMHDAGAAIDVRSVTLQELR